MPSAERMVYVSGKKMYALDLRGWIPMVCPGGKLGDSKEETTFPKDRTLSGIWTLMTNLSRLVFVSMAVLTAFREK